MRFLENLTFPGGFIPHGNSYLWMPSLIGLHVASDSVSHDLRAPLRQMDGFSRILVEDYGPQLPPDAKQHVETEAGPRKGAAFFYTVKQPPPRQAVTPSTGKSA